MLSYLLFSALVIGAGYGLHHYWQRRLHAELTDGAEVEFTRLSNANQTLMDGVEKPHFAQIYRAALMPRFPAYALAAVAIFLLGSPIALGLLAGLAHYAVEWGWVPQAQTVATDIYLGSGNASVIRKADPDVLYYLVQNFAGFYYYFGLLFFWIAVVYFLMKRYHRNAPGSLEDEVRRAK